MRIGLIAAALILVAVSASAEPPAPPRPIDFSAVPRIARAPSHQSPDERACFGAAPPQIEIDGCTRLLDSGALTTDRRAYALNNRGGSRLEIKDFQGAVADLTLAIGVAPPGWEGFEYVYLTRAKAERHLQDFPAAFADLARAAKLARYPSPALDESCWAHAFAGTDIAVGQADCDRAVNLEASLSGVSSGLRARGFMKLRQGDPQGAVDDETAALARNSIDAPALYIRGLAELKRGETATGQADVARAKSWHAGVADDFADWIR